LSEFILIPNKFDAFRGEVAPVVYPNIKQINLAPRYKLQILHLKNGVRIAILAKDSKL
jgi:hypothetical protein